MNWEILLNYVNREANEQEVLRVNKWLEQQPENKQLLNYLEKRKAQLNTPLKQNDIHEQWVRLLDRIFEQDSKNGKANNWYLPLGIAASVLLISALAWFYLKPTAVTTPQVVTLQTPAGRQGKVTLPDGTEVFLAPASKIQYDNSYGLQKRTVSLKGEAFFAVKHDAHKPFIVAAQSNLRITVLGTSFNVYSKKGLATEVKVATGLVGVTGGKKTCYLKAGQQLSCNGSNTDMLVNRVEVKEASALQNQTLFFKNNNALEIAAKLQRWYSINVEVLPSANTHPRFSGEMKDTGVANLLKGLSYATGLHYRYKDSNTILLF